MGKSVYSIVLSDDVVREVDNKAYQLNTSRSALINKILAAQLGCETPEQKMQDIFEYIGESLSGAFKIINQASSSMFSLASPVSFKYRPVAKYLIELAGTGGRIRVEFRTSSAEFINYLNIFYEFFARLENTYLKDIKVRFGGGKFIREFKTADGEKITEYIRMFDESIKTFFEHIDRPNEAMHMIENNYKQYILKGNNLI